MNDPKRVLIAVDGSENSWRAVEYVVTVLAGVPDVWACALSVERLPSRDRFPTEEQWTAACRIHRERMEGFLARCRQSLEAAGLAAETAVIPACQGPDADAAACSLGTSIARDIIAFQEQGGYGTVVVGRRGVSRAEEFLFGSVTTKVTHLARNCAVWVVQ